MAIVRTALISFIFSKVVLKLMHIIHGNIELMTDKIINLKSNQANRFRDEVHACLDRFNAMERAVEQRYSRWYAKHGR